MKPMRVAIVGAGNIGWWHALAFAAQPAQWQVVALCDSDPARAQAMAARLQADPQVAAPEVLAFDTLLARADVDLVDICTPPFLHVAQCEAALDSGKHVLCEKPLAASLSEIDRLDKAQSRNARQLLPIFQNRFSRATWRASSPCAGPGCWARTTSRRWKPPGTARATTTPSRPGAADGRPNSAARWPSTPSTHTTG